MLGRIRSGCGTRRIRSPIRRILVLFHHPTWTLGGHAKSSRSTLAPDQAGRCGRGTLAMSRAEGPSVMTPTIERRPRRRGEHGPSLRKQARRARNRPPARRRSGHPRVEGSDLGRAAEPRSGARGTSRVGRARWPHWAYLYYCDLLENGLCEGLLGRTVSSGSDGLPAELDDLPVRTRRQLSPAQVAGWAYLHRVCGRTFPAIADLEKAGLQQPEAGVAGRPRCNRGEAACDPGRSARRSRGTRVPRGVGVLHTPVCRARAGASERRRHSDGSGT